MTRLFLILVFIIQSQFSESQNYKPVDDGSKVHFVIKNFGINTGGDLSGLQGSIVFNSIDLTKCDFTVTVDVKTIDTDNGNRDEHLRSDDYFDVKKFPVIIIKSSRIERSANDNGDGYTFYGTLTIHGTARNITFPFTVKPMGNDYVFNGEFEIDRLDYGVGESSAIMSKTVKVSLTVLARKI